MALIKNCRPKCKKKDCFACIDGQCIALQYQDAEALNGGHCAFYKTEEQYRKGLKDYPPTLDAGAFIKYENARRTAKMKSNLKNYY